MRGIGLSLPNRGLLFGAISVEEMLELAERADSSAALGSVWVGDGLIAKPRVEAVVSLSAIAARTRRVRLGTCCLATFPLRNPVLFACQWASLDVMSQGRALLAVCLGAATERSGGSVAHELQATGVQADERVGRLEEGIAVLRKVWSGATDHAGKYWSFDEIDLLPKPVQQPCPIWIASNPSPDKLSGRRYQAAIDRVGRLADGWMSTVVSPDEFGRRWAGVQEAAQRAGRDPSALTSAVHLMINLADDEATARTEAKRFLDTYYLMDTTDETMDRWGAYGTPAQVLDRLQAYLAEGLDVPILRFASYDQTAQMDRAEQALLPELAERVRVAAR